MAGRLADHYGLDRDLVDSLIRAESAYNPNAVSSAGAIGLMQVMPATAADYGVPSANRLRDPETNLHTGMRHLKRLLVKYGKVGEAVMAYNAGEGALERGNGFVSYAETQRYTHQVLTGYLRRKGITPYSEGARKAVGMTLTPAMASAGGTRKSSRTPAADAIEQAVPESRWSQSAPRPGYNRVAQARLDQNRRHVPRGGVRQPAANSTRLAVNLPRYRTRPGSALTRPSSRSID